MRPVLFLLAALRIALAANSGSAMVGYLPSDAKVVMGINVRALADAGLFQEIAGSIPKEVLPGFDVTKDLDEAIIATSGIGEKPPALAVLRGRFNMEKFARDATLYKGVPIHGPVALIDETTAIAGDLELIHAAIDLQGKGMEATPRIDAQRKRFDIWGFGTDLPAADRFEFGAAFRNGLRLTAEIHVRSDKDVEQMTSALKMVEAMMKGKAKKPSNGSDFDFSIDNGTLKVSLAIPEAELKKAIREERTSMLTALASGMPLPRPTTGVKAAEPRAIPSQAPPAPPQAPVIGGNGDTVIVTLPGAR